MKRILRSLLNEKFRRRLQRIQFALRVFYTKDLLKYMGNRVEIGEYSYGKPDVLHWNEKTKLKIGKFCSISDSVTIFLGGNHRTDWVTTYPFIAFLNEWQEADGISGYPVTNGDVVIGNDVWIGYGASILSGVTIGDGAVIGAFTLVTKDVAPYTIVGGNPAKELRKRFDEKKIGELLKMKWWDWPIEKIRKNIPLLCSSNIEEILEVE